MAKKDTWPERRKTDHAATIDALTRAVDAQAGLLQSIDSKLASLVSHIMSGFDLVAENNRHPYSLRAGLDDVSAVDTRTLLWIRDALMTIEAEMARKHEIMGQIRNGKYDPEQPGAPRRLKTNGK